MSEIKTFEIQASEPDPRCAIVDRGNRYVGVVPFDDEIGQHLALLPKSFNPEADEVLIVPKNGRRVWIEQFHATEHYLHTTDPWWSADMNEWLSVVRTNSMIKPIDGMTDHDCIEFVQVATHRPPEPEKPVGPKSTDPRQLWKVAMDEVRSRFPDATLESGGGTWGLTIGRHCVVYFTQEETWLRMWELIQADEAHKPVETACVALRQMQRDITRVQEVYPGADYDRKWKCIYSETGMRLSEPHDDTPSAWRSAAAFVDHTQNTPPVNVDYFSTFVVDTRSYLC